MPRSNDADDRHELISYTDDIYRTAEGSSHPLRRLFPTLDFYRQFGWNVYQSSRQARAGVYDEQQWSRTSHMVLKSLESVGVRIEIQGVQNIRSLDSPCVFVGNHMSMLETIVLPAIIQPVHNVTFVTKQSLLDYPVFRHILRSRNPVAVSRNNPREDFKVVMTEGKDRLDRGISIVVFPQTTRSATFDPAQFNTIGIKLASRAGVPVIPIALQTDAWGNGRRLKDFGRIDATKVVRFAFGPPISVTGRGEQQHQQVIDFIESKLAQWSR
ncbi:1-acyl-sn-glycerol-3-phosphate acyltransferase [Rubripirellula tenax]|uniref:1-acyl-sn-glycerol-3-phosphate acyltransferase n=1 Tax=Rubripirellula tenax TaxID=2528015 RepID=A0A5C6EPK6_9BACT|nr:lysophospholipid acyltransferase family protein [Rubripirellula tenax]TWU51032.1 1-acyl-sn-glycerol-3-phosphate acyltransferase [Rubripirellula tenax]